MFRRPKLRELPNPDLFYERANRNFMNGMFDDAIRDYTFAIRFTPIGPHPIYAYIYNNRGLSYYQLGNFEKAIEDFSTAIKLDPLNARIFTNRANAYAANDQHIQATIDFHLALHTMQSAQPIDTSKIKIYTTNSIFNNKSPDSNQNNHQYSNGCR